MEKIKIMGAFGLIKSEIDRAEKTIALLDPSPNYVACEQRILKTCLQNISKIVNEKDINKDNTMKIVKLTEENIDTYNLVDVLNKSKDELRQTIERNKKNDWASFVYLNEVNVLFRTTMDESHYFDEYGKLYPGHGISK